MAPATLNTAHHSGKYVLCMRLCTIRSGNLLEPKHIEGLMSCIWAENMSMASLQTCQPQWGSTSRWGTLLVLAGSPPHANRPGNNPLHGTLRITHTHIDRTHRQGRCCVTPPRKRSTSAHHQRTWRPQPFALWKRQACACSHADMQRGRWVAFGRAPRGDECRCSCVK